MWYNLWPHTIIGQHRSYPKGFLNLLCKLSFLSRSSKAVEEATAQQQTKVLDHTHNADTRNRQKYAHTIRLQIHANTQATYACSCSKRRAKEEYPMSTSTGSTKMAIWMEEPRATPMAKSILFL